MGQEAVIFNVQRFSTEDGPGIRTSIFFKGCPMTCPWCHNPEGLDKTPGVIWQGVLCIGCDDCETACPEHAIERIDGRSIIDGDACRVCGTCADTCPPCALEVVGRSVSAEDLLAEVSRDRTFYDKSDGGITLTGGEPLSQYRFLFEFLPIVRQSGIHVTLDTCGVATKDAWESVLPMVDMVLFDIKTADESEHSRLTGIKLDKVLQGLDKVAGSGLPVRVRTPMIPGYTDREEDIRAVAELVKEHVPGLIGWDLLAFSNLCTSKYEVLGMDFGPVGRPLMTVECMDHLADVARKAGVVETHWSGPTRSREDSQ